MNTSVWCSQIAQKEEEIVFPRNIQNNICSQVEIAAESQVGSEFDRQVYGEFGDDTISCYSLGLFGVATIGMFLIRTDFLYGFYKSIPCYSNLF